MLTKIIKNNYNIINFLIALIPISYARQSHFKFKYITNYNHGNFLFKFEVFVTKEDCKLSYLFFFFYVIFVTIFNNIDSIMKVNFIRNI